MAKRGVNKAILVGGSEVDEVQQQVFWSKVRVGSPTECWPWLGAKKTKGYGNVRINGRYLLAHRVAFELSACPIPPELLVCHVCDNPPCCNPAHLMLGTTKSNAADMIAKGRDGFMKNRAVGTRNANSKLTDEAVAEIRKRYAASEITQKELADIYGVTQSTIGSIVRRSTWRHVA